MRFPTLHGEDGYIMKRIHKKILAIFTAILLAVTTFVLAGEKTFSAWAVGDLETVDETTSQTEGNMGDIYICLLYTSPSPRD